MNFVMSACTGWWRSRCDGDENAISFGNLLMGLWYHPDSNELVICGADEYRLFLWEQAMLKEGWVYIGIFD